MSIFRKKVEPACRYCAHGFEVSKEFVNCTKKKKMMDCDSKCMRFQYDPLKRVPAKQKALDFSKYEEYDFSL